MVSNILMNVARITWWCKSNENNAHAKDSYYTTLDNIIFSHRIILDHMYLHFQHVQALQNRLEWQCWKSQHQNQQPIDQPVTWQYDWQLSATYKPTMKTNAPIRMVPTRPKWSMAQPATTEVTNAPNSNMATTNPFMTASGYWNTCSHRWFTSTPDITPWSSISSESLCVNACYRYCTKIVVIPYIQTRIDLMQQTRQLNTRMYSHVTLSAMMIVFLLAQSSTCFLWKRKAEKKKANAKWMLSYWQLHIYAWLCIKGFASSLLILSYPYQAWIIYKKAVLCDKQVFCTYHCFIHQHFSSRDEHKW